MTRTRLVEKEGMVTVHLRYEGRSVDLTFEENLHPLTDKDVLTAVAQKIDVAPAVLESYVVERGEVDLVVHPQAVYG